MRWISVYAIYGAYIISMYHTMYRYWSAIDDALRSAAYNRGVRVRLMGSYWNHTSSDMVQFLASLSANSGIGPLNGSIETVSALTLSARIHTLIHKHTHTHTQCNVDITNKTDILIVTFIHLPPCILGLLPSIVISVISSLCFLYNIEIFHCASCSKQEHSIHTSQPQQVYGHR